MHRRGIEGFVGRVKPSHSRVPRGVACDDLNESHISRYSASIAIRSDVWGRLETLCLENLEQVIDFE